MKSLRVFFLLGLALTGWLFSGCESVPTGKSYGLKVAVDKSLAGSSIQVNIIGANAVSDLPKWQTMSVTEYWQPDSPQRRDAEKVVMKFGPGQPQEQTLSATDAVWQRWLPSATYLVILVDLPGVSTDREGNADPRRLILPLDKKKWGSGTETIELRVQESGVRLLTPVKTP